MDHTIRDESGGIVAWHGLMMDADDMVSSERSVRKEEGQLRRLVDSIPSMIWRADPSGRIDRINQEPIVLDRLHDRLLSLLADGGNPVIFLRGERQLEFRRIAEVIDIAKGAGVNRIAFMTN